MTDADQTAALVEQVAAAIADDQPLAIEGSASKAFYGNPTQGRVVSTLDHRGIVNYEPTELVLTARAGTPIDEIEAALADKGQRLAFEPPHFNGGGSVGGMVAAGLSGPARPYAGAVRDMVLGIRLINGRAETMRFGGEVMKNVAGYDVARLNTGALGTLGIITEVSLKVLPAMPATATLRLAAAPGDCHRLSEQWLRAGRPLTGMLHDGDQLHVRFEGTASAVEDAQAALGGEMMEASDAAAFWQSIRDHRHAFFTADERPLWRLALPPGVDPADFGGSVLVDWSGQQLWLRGREDADALRAQAAAVGGSATLFRGELPGVAAFAPLDAVKAQLHRHIKQAFDPHGVLNPGRLYPQAEVS